MEIISKNNNSRVFIIGDIHGCCLTFDALLDEIKLNQKDEVYLLGDLIDRGPRSKEVFDKIFFLVNNGFKISSILGNHEYMLITCLENSYRFPGWFVNGADSTLKSFGVRIPEKIEAKYLEFILNMPYYIELKDFILVHGGLNFEAPDPLKDVEAMVWTRNVYINKQKIGDRRIIVGHTPSELTDIIKSLTQDRLLLDGGCVYSRIRPNLGKLCCLELNSMELFSISNLDF